MAEEASQVDFVDAADRVKVASRTVILCVIAAQSFVYISSRKNEQEAILVSRPRRQRCHEVRHDHADARLNVLQC